MAITVPTSAKNGTGSFGGTTIEHLTNITFNQPQELEVYATSSTAGQRTRLAGHQDSSGEFTLRADPSNYGISRGTEGILILKYASGETAFNGNAIIGDVNPTIDINAGSGIEWTVSWGQKPDTSTA